MKILSIILGIISASVGGVILFGGPKTLPAMASVNDPFANIDYSQLATPSFFAARDGEKLAYRYYKPAPNADAKNDAIILVHGSSASSQSMHSLALALANVGYQVYALDIRGHGLSAEHGKINYIGQLNDDLVDFVSATDTRDATLIGFSSGGGFALRFAGSAHQKLFANYILISPYIAYNAANNKPDAGTEWAALGLPRFMVIAWLNSIGIKIFNNLPVLNFALDDSVRTKLTPWYGFNLMINFQPLRDYKANIAAAHQPMTLVVGENDELFIAQNYQDIFAKAGSPVPVTIVPKAGHVDMITNKDAIATVVLTIANVTK